MGGEIINNDSEFILPFGRRVKFQQLEYDGGLKMLRLTFREAKRFTTIDLDKNSAAKLGEKLASWAKEK